ncbi:MAG: hypothetical protein JNK90_00905 [Planctomycetaceae bacterium]|nr:hypothetical protein [Planctomycetaceae bacterium]
MLLFNVSLKVIICYRLQRYLSKRKRFKCGILQLLLGHWQVSRGNCQISPKAVIGKRLKLQHPIGVVIGQGCTIGNDVSLWQNVTLGNDGRDVGYPCLEDNVRIFAGSMVIGNVVVGASATVGAMSLVTSDIPPDSVAYGIPARVKAIGYKEKAKLGDE